MPNANLTNTTKMANRFGLDIKFYTYADDGTVGETPLATIDFANEVSLDLSSDLTWATGGQAHSNKVGFRNPYEGTMKISTQLVDMTLLALIAGGDLATASTTVTFKNDENSAKHKYYIIKGTTVWQDEDGNAYNEEITAFKACVKPNYSVTYNGSGDPQSLDVEFDLGANTAGEVVQLTRTDSE